VSDEVARSVQPIESDVWRHNSTDNSIMKNPLSVGVVLFAFAAAVVPSQAAAADDATGQPKAPAFDGTKAGQVRDDNGLKIRLIWCPSGTFTMGSSKDEASRWRGRSRRKPDGLDTPIPVTLTRGFWLGSNEVTQAQWRTLMQTTPWRGKKYVKEGDAYPATYVSWNDAMKFCELLSQNEWESGHLPSGWQYALPTEAEWEYACRAGTTTAFSFGDDAAKLGDYAWFQPNTTAAGDKYAHEVGKKKLNPWGFADMHGNVWEWCRDGTSEKLPGGTDPEVLATGSLRMRRGGAWGYGVGQCRSASREAFFVGAREFYTGFRLAVVRSAK
jgi:formylglycine-generating enzyme required for sulfatase activity